MILGKMDQSTSADLRDYVWSQRPDVENKTKYKDKEREHLFQWIVFQ